MTSFNQQWSIDHLGECEIKSSLQSRQFAKDDETLLLDPSVQGLKGDKHALEKAGPREYIYFQPSETIAGIVTCGGICPALNNVIRSVTYELYFNYKVKKILGFKYGYEGLNPTTSQVVELTPSLVRDIHQFGGCILGSSRGPQAVPVMVDFLIENNVNILFCIGGDGTQKGALAISQEIKKRGLKMGVVGIPKTIDNDICHVERTFGFETAIALAQPALQAAHEEARSARNGIGIVKLMGRESGFIALHAALASGDVNILLLPEMSFDIDDIASYIVKRFEKTDHCLILVSEGAGQDICLPQGGLGQDKSGNVKFADIGLYLKKELSDRLIRMSIEHTIKYIDPSYIIRSAPAVPSDAIFALQLGQMAVHAAMAGKTGLIVGMIHSQFVHLPIEKAVEYRKKVDIDGSVFQSFVDCSGMPLELVDKKRSLSRCASSML